MSDPKCYYDPELNRFYLTILTIDQDPESGAFTGGTGLQIAVSKDSSPDVVGTGLFDRNDWYFYTVDTTNDGQNGTPDHECSPPDDPTGVERPNACLGDQPLIGADKYGFFVTTNEFELFGDEFNGAQIYAFDKAGLAGGTLRFQLIDGKPIPLAEGPAYSVQPATSPTHCRLEQQRHGIRAVGTRVRRNVPRQPHCRVGVHEHAVADDRRTSELRQQGHARLSTVRRTASGDAEEGCRDPARRLGGEPENLIDANDDRMNQVVCADGKLWSAPEHRHQDAAARARRRTASGSRTSRSRHR